MVVQSFAPVFAAGDNGVRSFGSAQIIFSPSFLHGSAARLHAQSATLLTVLPNARLTPIYGTAEAVAGQNADREDLGWRCLLGAKPVVGDVQSLPSLAVPVREPALPGYPGVLIFERNAGESAFTAADVDAALEQARQIEKVLAARRPAVPSGVYLFDAKLKNLINESSHTPLNADVRKNLLEDAKSRLGKRSRRSATRVRIFDAHGIALNFRVETRKKFPADAGSVLAYTVAPRVCDWAQLDDSAFSAMPQIVRLLPALKFMIAKFASLPGLPQIAAKAKLSPYHFHREFSALLGISPKHVMLDCQIESACRQLQMGEVELVDIARSCGFAHQSHFTSRFKQATGLTPTAWRKAMRSKG